jgi:hypothetical protein
MKKKTEMLDPLVKSRLGAIVGVENDKILSELLIAEPVFSRRLSVVFNAFYRLKEGEDLTEIFLELSRWPAGCADLRRPFLSLGGVPGIPNYFFSVTQEGVVIAIAYQKFTGAVRYQEFLRNNLDDAAYFFYALGELIDGVHERNCLLPPGWDNQDVLYVSKDRLPVIIGYNGLRPNRLPSDFTIGCRQDWNLLNYLVNDCQRNNSSGIAAKEFRDLKEMISEKLGKTTVA